MEQSSSKATICFAIKVSYQFPSVHLSPASGGFIVELITRAALRKA